MSVNQVTEIAAEARTAEVNRPRLPARLPDSVAGLTDPEGLGERDDKDPADETIRGRFRNLRTDLMFSPRLLRRAFNTPCWLSSKAWRFLSGLGRASWNASEKPCKAALEKRPHATAAIFGLVGCEALS